MGTAVDILPDVATRADGHLVVAELAGPTGAGKTSLAKALARRSKAAAVVTHPNARDIHDAPFFAANTLSLLPALFDVYSSGRARLTKAEIGEMAVLNGWHQVLRRRAPRGARLVILDQGPVFILGQLYLLRPEIFTRPRLKRWWKRMCRLWACEISTVMWLDACDADLVYRMRTRPERRALKDRGEAEIREYVARQRWAYQYVISVLTAHSGGPQVLRFDTTAEPSERIATRVLSVCDV